MTKKLERPITLDELEEQGKPILVEYAGVGILVDVVCRDKGKKTCETCKLRFNCLTQNPLKVTLQDIEKAARLPCLQTIESAVEMYLQSQKEIKS